MAINEQLGNEIPVPGFEVGTYLTDDEIMASTKGGFTQVGVTLAGGLGILPAGTVLGQVTATGLFRPYNDSNSPTGVGTARGVLRKRVDTTDGPVLANMVVAGIIKNSKLSGMDANGIADLNGRVDTVLNTFRF
jgi:hypothetical protein